MPSTLSELAALVCGDALGPAGKPVLAARPLHEAGPDDVAFVENERHLKYLATCKAGTLVVSRSLAAKPDGLSRPDGSRFDLIAVDDALAAFVALYRHLAPEPHAPPAGVSRQAVVHPTAALGPGCSVMPFAVVSEGAVLGARCVLYPGVYVGPGCAIGDDVVLHPHVTLYDRCVLGHRVVVHAHAVLGADGFGYRYAAGRHAKVPQLGYVVLGDDVEVGAGTAIDRGTFGPTRVGEGTKIDNLVQIGHNGRIGRHNLICGLTGIAGSVTTGDYVVLAGAVGVTDHITIGARAVVGARAGVCSDLDGDRRYHGFPARPEREALRILLTNDKLPEMWHDFREMKQQIEALKAAVATQQERKAG